MKRKIVKFIMWVTLCVYLVILTKVIIFKYPMFLVINWLKEWSLDSVVRSIDTANFIPFKGIFSISNRWEITLLIYNILAFIPLGCYIGCLFRRTSFLKALIGGIILSLLFEVIQLVTILGSFDVDDIILNTLGTLIGFILISAIKKKCKFIRKID